jgi:hypothetical protein
MIVFCGFTLLSGRVVGQDAGEANREVGMNVLQLLATTVDLGYEINNHPRYTLVVNGGLTVNHVYGPDLFGFILSPMTKCTRYTMKNQSGGFVKGGMKYNLRSSLEKNNYFFVGAYLTNALVYEKAEHEKLVESYLYYYYEPEMLDHVVNIFGLTGAVGYNFRFSKRLNSDLGVHISRASNQYHHLYGGPHYIPGMGYYDGGRIFPMMVWNLKYRL